MLFRQVEVWNLPFQEHAGKAEGSSRASALPHVHQEMRQQAAAGFSIMA